MPSVYAHYRFGAALLPGMPADARRTVQRFRRLFDLGLHGPDIFYFHTFPLNTATRYLGVKFHEQTGQEFFQRVCRAVRLERSEAALAYLYGVLCHYCLDSVMHPFVKEQAKAGSATHLEIEGEFERYLLEKDGKVPPCAQDLSNHLKITPGECETVAKFYSPASPRNIKDSVNGMAFIVKLLSAPEGAKRTVIQKGMGVVAREFTGLMIPAEPNPSCAHLDESLLELYEQAAAQFPEMLSQFQAHMTYTAPFGPEFEPIFG